MKSEEDVKRQLEEVYEHRLKLRIERKTKRMCRNCKFGVCKEFDLGDFGTISKWECKDGRNCGEYCGFECRSIMKDIEDEMLSDISDPAVCGAKEPKIAMLIWVLRDKKVSNTKDDEATQETVETEDSTCKPNEKLSIWEKLKKMIF